MTVAAKSIAAGLIPDVERAEENSQSVKDPNSSSVKLSESNTLPQFDNEGDNTAVPSQSSSQRQMLEGGTTIDHQQHTHHEHLVHPQHNNGGHAAGEHHDETHHLHQARIPFYTPPRQRQRWGDTQVAPHTNWGDVFFDLFYVAAAYNLGNVLAHDPTSTGLLYTAGLFFPILTLWMYKTFYDSRFYYQDDYYHRGYEIVILLALATAVLHIRSVPIMAQPKLHIDMFLFCLGVSIAYGLACGRLLEVMLCQRYNKSQTGLYPEAYSAVLNDTWKFAITALFFMLASAYAGWQYYNESTVTSYYNETTSSSAATESTSDSDKYPHRSLAESSTSPEVQDTKFDHVAVWLLLGGTFVGVATFLSMFAFFVFCKVDVQRRSVPMNMDFAIHRYGEWVMLMLGESVLSLLVVEIVDTTGYYQTFLCGMISITLLQYVHFHSAPTDPDKHAFRRGFLPSFLFYWLFQIYSISLIVLGVCYKMLLQEAVLMAEDQGEHRRQALLLSRTLDSRWLASPTATTASMFSPMQRQQRIAHLFSGSLSLAFFCLDAKSLAHRGITVQLARCERANTPFKKVLLKLLILIRVLSIIFAATMSQYVTNPIIVAAYGTVAILVQVLVRLVGSYVFRSNEENELQAIEMAIHYVTSRIHDRPEHIDSATPHISA